MLARGSGQCWRNQSELPNLRAPLKMRLLSRGHNDWPFRVWRAALKRPKNQDRGRTRHSSPTRKARCDIATVRYGVCQRNIAGAAWDYSDQARIKDPRKGFRIRGA